MEKLCYQQGAKLRLMGVLIAALCFVYAVGMGFYTVNAEIELLEARYEKEMEEHEYMAETWDMWVEEHGIQAVIEHVGIRPVAPEKEKMTASVWFEVLSKTMLILIAAIFMCSVLHFYSVLVTCAPHVLKRPPNDSEAADVEAVGESEE